ncbi:MAG: c-type cytochrome [Candidatus Eremiobacteraeota bacterium]|nr:c-type cytochrome [Candidatus Eremiobacteraeota bacterium]
MGRLLRWAGYAAIALVVIALIGYGILVVDSNREIAAPTTAVPPVGQLGHPSLQRGKHLFTAVAGCIDCHGADGGGGPFISQPAMAMLYAPNLTRGPGGVGAVYSDADYDRAIRRGIRADGTRLLIMPSWDYAVLSDDDAASVIAYIRSLPPVDRATPRVKLGPVGRMLVATHQLPFDATRIADEGLSATPPPPPGTTLGYGEYLTRVAGCQACHGIHFSGGHLAGPPDVPAAANITPTGIGTWDETQFLRTLTTGKDPNGHYLNDFMPWRTIKYMTDDELITIFNYLKRVPPRPTGTG